MKRKLLMLAGASLVAGSAANAALLVHYTFDGGDATNSGTLNDGTVSGGASYTSSGAGFFAGDCFVGNGAGADDAHIKTTYDGTTLGFGAGGVYTAMAWILWNGGGASGDQMVFGQDDAMPTGNAAQLHHGIRNDSVANVHFGGWGGAQDIADAGTVASGTWTHVAWQYDGTDKVVYVDGVEITRAAGNNITDPALDVLVGGHTRDGNATNPFHSFDGCLDEVRIYDEVLDAAAILAARNVVIPEPSSLSLLGLAALGLIRRRR